MEIEQIIKRYDSFLIQEGIFEPLFEITDMLVKCIYFKYVYPTTKLPHLDVSDRKRTKLLSTQLNYTRLSLLRVKYFRNGNRSTSIREGYVYCMTNPAFDGYYKIGSTIDVKTRLASYQTYAPKRDFQMNAYYFCHDRFSEEKCYHKMLPFDGEWCFGDVNPIIELFVSKKVLNSLRPDDWDR